MGLAFCRRATELLGGSIECTSVRGAHTTFIVRLPLPGSAADRALSRSPVREARRR
jgi:signal transduction histidine kinase